jgi:transcriptional regulator with XRE-family HTH domain
MKKNHVHPIKAYCFTNNITQKEIANKLGITDIYLGKILKYKSYPSRTLSKKISQLTGIPILQLLYPEDYKDLDLDIKNYQRHNHNQGVA